MTVRFWVGETPLPEINEEQKEALADMVLRSIGEEQTKPPCGGAHDGKTRKETIGL